MAKGSKVLISAVLLAALAGCGTDNNDNGNVQTNRVRVNDVGDSQRLSVSEKASRAVEKLDEVDRAHVIIQNNNAYVAVRMDDNGNNRANTQGNGNNGNGNNGNDMLENGRINQNGDDGIINGKGDAGNKDNKNGNAATQNTKNDNSNRAGSGTENFGYGTGNGTGYGTGNDNGMANGLGNGNSADLGNGNNNGLNQNTDGNGANTQGTNETPENNGDVIRDQNYTGVSTAFEQKIADQVRKADKKIHRVYISFNPDFYNTMNDYAGDITNGRDNDGLFTDFTDTMRQVFSNNR